MDHSFLVPACAHSTSCFETWSALKLCVSFGWKPGHFWGHMTTVRCTVLCLLSLPVNCREVQRGRNQAGGLAVHSQELLVAIFILYIRLLIVFFFQVLPCLI